MKLYVKYLPNWLMKCVCMCIYIYKDMNKIYQNAETFFLHGEIMDDICFPLNVFFLQFPNVLQ